MREHISEMEERLFNNPRDTDARRELVDELILEEEE